jgi:hypothetical protein
VNGNRPGQYGLSVKVLDLYDHPTIASLAAFLRPPSAKQVALPTRLFTPELQWQSRGKWRVLQGLHATYPTPSNPSVYP